MTKKYLKARNQSGATPLADAVMYGRLDIAEEMVQKKANVNTVMGNKKCLLHIAAEKYTDTAELARVHKFCAKETLEWKDEEGNTPLLAALKKDQQANAAWLLSQGAKGDCMNTAKETPYSVAQAKGYDQFLKSLADKGIKS